MQLQVYKNVKQYSPVHKKFIRTANADLYLKEHIIKGDRGDGIPNVASPDSCFVNGTRQKPMRKKMIEFLINSNMLTDDISEDIKRNFSRNRQLVDLALVPEDIQERILDTYKNYNEKDRSGLFNYFMKHKLRNLMDNISEF